MAAMSELAQQIKQLQRSSPGAREAWRAHCDESLGGMHDPARHDDNELQAFLDWWEAEGSSSAAAQGPDDGLVQQVKKIQKSGPGGRSAWEEHCDTELGGIHDPSRHDAAVLQAFVDWWKAEGAVAAGGSQSSNSKLVQQVKTIQRSGPAGKQAWEEHADAELGGVRDPSRHDPSVLQAFVDWWSSEGGDVPAVNDPPPASLVQQIKNLQRSDPEMKEQWQQYCQSLGGMCDPSRHGASTLQEFLNTYGYDSGTGDSGPISPPAGRAARAGGKGGKALKPASKSSDFIRLGAVLCPRFKSAWAQYCRLYGQGFSDPAKYDDAFLQEFASYTAGLLQADLANAAPGTAEAPKRAANTPAGGEPAAKKKLSIKKSVADEIARLNKLCSFPTPIRLAAVAGPLSELEESMALDIVSSLENQEVEDPNELLISMCQLSVGAAAEGDAA